MIAPMEQFKIHRVVELPTIAGVDLSITSVTLAMLIAAGAVGALLAGSLRAGVVPGRLQSVGELLFELIDDLATSVIGRESRAFVPLIFTLFVFIAAMNVLGMFVVLPTATSQLAVTATLAVLTIAIVLIVGLARNGLGFFKLFVPSGVPVFLLPLLVPIEVISFVVRPLTLSLRLFGNMIAGHVLLNVFASFVVALALLALGGGIATLGWLVSALSLGSAVAFVALEFIVALLQAFVFALLACVYLNDVVNLHSH